MPSEGLECNFKNAETGRDIALDRKEATGAGVDPVSHLRAGSHRQGRTGPRKSQWEGDLGVRVPCCRSGRKLSAGLLERWEPGSALEFWSPLPPNPEVTGRGFREPRRKQELSRALGR